ncbi:VOC family protein [Geodermatophilus sabuli]|uniref:2-oxoadipate dioxygenase/decarboxylase n=1 Tax=Geodermatophilus sabuli TaxID=1564158 RepID=A0A7K3VXV0_9ACTN|nr:VOC family protein [Geodermatophilus sabuli]NEK56694.1 VOC family protein [Geodermatophilus sabuli]
MSTVVTTELRARFARRLSELYGREVPAYTTLVDVSAQVNRRVMERDGAAAERLGSIDRVTAERHGAIRVGTPQELSQVARVFAALGMHPTGFYDLRDADPQPVPVVSTAFRPVDRTELARNPFRVFTSMLVPQDRRFFDEDLERRLSRFLAARTLFPGELLDLADRAEAEGELGEADAARFLDLATGAFALSADPVDRGWYTELERVSGVAADIGGVTTTHVNHLTPRVLDIDDLYASMQSLGVQMIDEIQGPPRWQGPDVLLRQTSFRALAEPRRFREADGTIAQGELRVRFGEVEARGIALTPRGRELYDDLVAEVDRRLAETPGRPRQDVGAEVWAAGLPDTEAELVRRDLTFCTFRPAERRPDGTEPPRDLAGLLDGGWLVAEPIVYEDFLPRSAAGIFASNLSGRGEMDAGQGGAPRDADWLAGAIGRPVRIPEQLYAEQRAESLARAAAALGIPGGVSVEPVAGDAVGPVVR